MFQSAPSVLLKHIQKIFRPIRGYIPKLLLLRGHYFLKDIPLAYLIGALCVLVLLSAFFSSSETAMMALNRYRLRHLEKQGNRAAIRAAALLRRPDRLIGVILIGNNFINVLAASIATLIALKLYGGTDKEEAALGIATLLLTIIVLVFSEVTPKTIAATRPQMIAFPASFILRPLLFCLYPLVWSINSVSNFLAKLLGVDTIPSKNHADLHPDELKTVLDEAGGLIPQQHQSMLLNILDLENATVEDIMIPRNEVIGLNLDNPVSELLEQIRTSEYTRLPVFEGDINHVVGFLHLRQASRFIVGADHDITHEHIRQQLMDAYFVPEGTPLNTQLLNFQKKRRRIALTVDEYGDVQGLITMEDLLEEIVGEFTTNLAEDALEDIKPLEDGWYAIDGSASIRDINKALSWKLPSDGPKTLNGLMMEHLEIIPKGHISFMIGSYRFETQALSTTMIEKARVKNIRKRGLLSI